MSRVTYALVGVVAAAVGALTATGFALASSSSPSVKACMTSAGYLKLARSDGTCPTGSSAVTINAQGKPGLAAKSAFLDRTTAGGSVTRTLPHGDTLNLSCGNNDGVPVPILVVSAANPSDLYYVHGTAQDGSQGGSSDYEDSATTQVFNPGTNLIGQAPTGYFSIGADGLNGPGYAYAHLFVNDGTDVFTIDASLYSAAGRCQLIVQATPSTS